MFDIQFGVTTEEKGKVNKNVNFDFTATGTLKDATSIVEPVLLVKVDIVGLSYHNYMYIENFGRYYYITDMVSVRNGLVEIHAKCDPLMSFKQYLYNVTAIIDKQTFAYNLYLPDGTLKKYAYPIVREYMYSNGFDTTNGDYVLTVAGK